MRHQQQEFTLKNALSDPLVRSVMAADGVDPRELSSMLRKIVATLDRRSQHPVEHGFHGSLCATNCA